MSGKDYTVTGSGTNADGNHWCSRQDNKTGNDGYHYSNKDDSYYYKNQDGSKYYDDGKGSSKYTAPDGKTYKK